MTYHIEGCRNQLTASHEILQLYPPYVCIEIKGGKKKSIDGSLDPEICDDSSTKDKGHGTSKTSQRASWE